MDPSRVSALKHTSTPEKAAELCEFIHCCRWMSNAIPAFAERISVLNDVVEKAYAISKRRTKNSVKNVKLSNLSWGVDHTKSFYDIQKSLRDAVRLAYSKPNCTVCIFMDASYKFWSAVVTQVQNCELSLPLEEQKHEPLAVLGAEFKGREFDWTTYEIFRVFEKLDYLFYNEAPTHVFTDHRNVMFVFEPLSLESAPRRQQVSKVQRWALYLSRFHYIIDQISGNRNVFADISTRWLKGYRSEKKSLKRLCKLHVDSEQLVPSSSSSDFVWPRLDVIRSAKQSCTAYK